VSLTTSVPFFQHGVRSSAACGGEPVDIRSRKAVDDRTGLFLQSIFLNDDSRLRFFVSIPWVNNRLVTRHLFAVSGCSPSQKIEFGSKPAGL
jgi:hypothetical protein